jgi:hypothetical protein
LDDSIDEIANFISTETIGSKEKTLLLPTSRLLVCALRLLVTWKRQFVLGNSKRRRCFENAIKGLVKCLSDCDQINNTAPVAPDLFTEAFSLAVSPANVITAAARCELFRHESAAYIVIFLTLTEATVQSADIVELCNTVWNILSDDVMRLRISAEHRESPPYTGDTARLLVAAKVIAFLTRSLMNEEPAELESSDACSSRTLQTSTLEFLVSRLVLCLACACEQRQNRENVVYILNYIRLVLLATQRSTKQLEVERTMKCVMDPIMWRRCFQSAMQAPLGSELEITFLKIFTESVRLLIVLFPDEGDEVSVQQEPSTIVDDEFDILDDALLGSIDLGDTALQSTGTTAFTLPTCLSSIYGFLVDVLVMCRPSSRNAVAPLPCTGDLNGMTSHGMHFIGEHYNMICSLLTDITAFSWSSTCHQRMLWEVETRFVTRGDQGDSRYMKRIAIALTKLLCRNRTNRNVVELVRRSKESVLFNFIETLVDNNRLSKVPSCNLVRIGASSGLSGECNGFTELSNYQNGKRQSLSALMMGLRDFGDNLGKLLLLIHAQEGRAENEELGDLLLEFYRCRDDTTQSRLGPSIELECFHRFKLLRDMTHSLSSNRSNWTSFERLSCLLLASCSGELARVLQKMGPQDRAHEGVTFDCYEKAKLFETVACYCELYTGLLASIFRDSSYSSVSRTFLKVLFDILDGFISPLFEEQRFVLASALKICYARSAAFLSGVAVAATGMELFSFTCDEAPYRGMLRKSVLRRSRDFVVFVATHFKGMPSPSSSGFLTAIFGTVATESIPRGSSIVHCFGSVDLAMTLVDVDPKQTSPLEGAIEGEFARMIISKQQASAVRDLRLCALKQGIVRQMTGSNLCAPTRIWFLQLSAQLLDLEHETGHDRGDKTIDTSVLCSVAKGIGTCIHQALIREAVVPEELISASFLCARSLIMLPAACAKRSEVGYLVDWMNSFVAAEDDSSLHSLTSEEGHALYLSCFCKWLSGLGKCICNGAAESIDALRFQLRSNGKLAVWSPIGPLPDQVLLCDRLNALETLLNPASRLANGETIINVYTVRGKNKTADTVVKDIQHTRWIPSNTVKATIAEFQTKAAYANTN